MKSFTQVGVYLSLLSPHDDQKSQSAETHCGPDDSTKPAGISRKSQNSMTKEMAECMSQHKDRMCEVELTVEKWGQIKQPRIVLVFPQFW